MNRPLFLQYIGLPFRLVLALLGTLLFLLYVVLDVTFSEAEWHEFHWLIEATTWRDLWRWIHTGNLHTA